MPRLIRQAFANRIRQSRDLQVFLEDFREVTGLNIRFLDPLGHHGDGESEVFNCSLCRHLHTTPNGTQLCLRFTQRLLEETAPEGSTLQCDAGLYESVVPLNAGGQCVGYFVFGPTAMPERRRTDLNRARHLLARIGVVLTEAGLADLQADAPLASRNRQEALRRLVAVWVEHFARALTHQLVNPAASLPSAVAQACRLIRAHAAEELSVDRVAKAVGLSVGHLSRQFHHSTGLRLVEYIARVRLEQATELIVAGRQPITEIAFACGFRSLSQFNRTFRRLTGRSPREWRAADETQPDRHRLKVAAVSLLNA